MDGRCSFSGRRGRWQAQPVALRIRRNLGSVDGVRESEAALDSGVVRSWQRKNLYSQCQSGVGPGVDVGRSSAVKERRQRIGREKERREEDEQRSG